MKAVCPLCAAPLRRVTLDGGEVLVELSMRGPLRLDGDRAWRLRDPRDARDPETRGIRVHLHRCPRERDVWWLR